MSVIAVSFQEFLVWLKAEHWGWTVLGFSATALFFLRFFIQWLKSEKAGRVVMPVSFWRFSLAGALLNLPYCLHLWREPLIVGAAVSLIVAIGNLNLAHHDGSPRSAFRRNLPWCVPVLFASFVAHHLLHDPLSWETVGYVGEVLFSSRFVIQWLASERKGAVVVPGYFWYLSLIGGCVRIAYAGYIWKMPILIPAIVSVLMSARNAWLHHRGKD